MESVEAANRVAKTNQTKIGVGIEQFEIHHAFWTTEWTVPNSFPIPGHLIFNKLPSSVTSEKLLHILPKELVEKVGRIHFYKEDYIAVVEVLDQDLVNEFLNDNTNIPLESGGSILVSPAYLILSLPKYADEDSFSKIRFSDKEELRYSLRSLEKYAPWVRHVYLVTNGQIPHWINLDHPRLSIITHEDIFEKSSHLPTYSSPAIESHLHRISGISKKFLYFNDDVFLGEEVWPSDFYDATFGQKVYFSWPLPDCAPGCPNNWIKDGYCDTICNTTECMHDGGDCIGSEIKMGFGGDNNINFHWNDSNENTRPTCAENCLDLWLSDSFCDDSCNVAECGYDAGDCGYAKYENLYQAPAINISKINKNGNWSVELPKGTTVAFWDFSKMFEILVEVALVPIEHKSVRAISLSQQHHFLTVVLYYNTSASLLNITLQGRRREDSKAEMFHISIKCDTRNHIPFIEPIEELHRDMVNLPDSIENVRGNDIDLDLSRVDSNKLNITEDDSLSISIILDQLRAEELTLKGFNVKKTAILQPYVRRYIMKGGRLENLFEDSDDDQEILKTLDKLDIPLRSNNTRNIGRKLMDAYGDSMLHVHRLLTTHYGFSNRLAISHMPHLIDKDIFATLKAKFFEEWDMTSSHQLRQHDDMQFAFSYFHYLISEKEEFDIHKVFHLYDTDNTGNIL